MTDSETQAARADLPPALICVDDDDRRSAVRKALDQLGYGSETPADAEEAVDRLRKVAYQVVVVDQAYNGGTALDNVILKALNTTPMSVRRYMFVALLAPDVKTLDNATAFSRSVNAVVHTDDVAQLGPLLRRAVADNDAFYRVFREVLQAAGKR
jgi:CheY-like chemotaxis protein